jgi:hypothetical protein
MLWIYRRADEVCPIEASFDHAAQQYVLVIFKGLSNERWERFTDEATFRTRLQLLDHEMSADRWEQTGPPVLLKDGWKL